MTHDPSTPTARRPIKRPRFEPKGTPRQQECWLRNIERQLAREAASLRRSAEKIDRITAKIAERLVASKPIELYTLADVVNYGHGAGRHYVSKLGGPERYPRWHFQGYRHKWRNERCSSGAKLASFAQPD